MKKAASIFLCMVFLFLTANCEQVAERALDIDSVHNYSEIPGVTEEEINAIEALKASKDKFIYGHILETESFKLPDGSFKGFTYKLCDLLTEMFGITFEPKLYESWDNLKNEFDEKNVDFIGELTSTPERMKIYQMTHAIAERKLRLYTFKDAQKKIKTEDDINGLKLGFLTETITAYSVKKAYPLDFEAVDIHSFADAAEMLKTGQVDGVVLEAIVEPNFEDYDFIESKDFFPLVYTHVSMASKINEYKPIISVVNKYLASGGINKLYQLYRDGEFEYVKYRLDKSFTEEERAYIQDLTENGKKVNLGLEHDNYPVCFFNDKENEFQGISVDILKEISSMTGIEFNVKSTRDTTWSEILRQLSSGEISMVSELLYSDQRKDNFLFSSVPFSSAYFVLMSKNEYPKQEIFQIIHSKVGVNKKTAYEDLYNEWFPDHTNLVLFETQNMALDSLEHGEFDLLMASEYLLLTQLNYRETPGYKVNIRFNTPMYSQFGFNINENILCSIIDKAQLFVKTEDIESDWESRGFDYSIKLANQRTSYMLWIIIILLFVLIYVVRLLIKNKRLSTNLDMQTTTVKTIYSSIPDMVFSFDKNLRYTSCNQEFEKFIGAPKEEIIGKTVFDLYKSNYEAARLFNQSNYEVLISGRRHIVEEWITFKDGSKKLFETIKTPLYQNGELSGMMGIARDITERKATEEKAKVASKAKSNFLANMSHEIRTPLNAIIGMANIAEKSIPDPKKTTASIKQIITSSNHLLGVINDVLDMSKIESGKLDLICEPFNIKNIYEETANIIEQRCSDKNIKLITHLNEIKNVTFLGDKLRLNQVLLNLLSNAVKFTDNGGKINYTIKILSEDSQNAQVLFSVSDNGIGMSREQTKKLFLPFEQTDNAVTARYGGTGLGLSISQNLVCMMGGKIKVESEKSKGSEFSFELNFKKVETAEGTEDDELLNVNLMGKRILIAEDIDVNRIIIDEMLKPTKVEIHEAADGEQALEMFTESSEKFFDLILMDIQMPVMNGYEAAKKIRALDRSDAKSVPIIAVTANVFIEDIDEAMDSGMNGHISKPMEISALMKILKKHI